MSPLLESQSDLTRCGAPHTELAGTPRSDRSIFMQVTLHDISLAGAMHEISQSDYVLVIVGGVNWGLVGLFQFDLVAAIFGGPDAALSRIIYILVGASALWQLVALGRAFSTDETLAQRAR
jgi:uncharacterized membrane protein YuzA (DUF378 family)